MFTFQKGKCASPSHALPWCKKSEFPHGLYNIPIVPEFHFPMGGHDLRVMQAELGYKRRLVKERAEISQFQAPPPKKSTEV